MEYSKPHDFRSGLVLVTVGFLLMQFGDKFTLPLDIADLTLPKIGIGLLVIGFLDLAYAVFSLISSRSS